MTISRIEKTVLEYYDMVGIDIRNTKHLRAPLVKQIVMFFALSKTNLSPYIVSRHCGYGTYQYARNKQNKFECLLDSDRKIYDDVEKIQKRLEDQKNDNFLESMAKSFEIQPGSPVTLHQLKSMEDYEDLTVGDIQINEL